MTVFWALGASGDWSTASDWQSGVAPTSSDDAVINNSNSVTVTGNTTAHSLALNNSTLTNSGDLTVGTTITLDGSYLRLNGGSVSARSITSDNGDYGTIYGHGTVTAAFSGYAFTFEANGGVLNIQSTG